jgi:hypothetical protein
MTAAEIEALLGPAEDVKWVQGESNWQRHRYGSLRLMLMAQPGDELDKGRLSLRSVRVWLDEPLALPASLRPTLTHEWVRPSKDDVVGRLRAAGIDFVVEANPYSEGAMENLVTSPADGGTVLLESDSGVVRFIEASQGPA